MLIELDGRKRKMSCSLQNFPVPLADARFPNRTSNIFVRQSCRRLQGLRWFEVVFDPRGYVNKSVSLIAEGAIKDGIDLTNITSK